jgi:hypothetical protein
LFFYYNIGKFLSIAVSLIEHKFKKDEVQLLIAPVKLNLVSPLLLHSILKSPLENAANELTAISVPMEEDDQEYTINSRLNPLSLCMRE